MANEDYNNIAPKTNPIPKEEYSPSASKQVIHEYGRIEKSKTIAKVTSIVLTVVGAGLILASVGGYTFGYKTTAMIETFELTAGTDHIEYNIYVGSSKVEPLKVQIHNQFMKRSEEIYIGSNIGEFEDLKPGMQYKISILEKGSLVASKNITTKYAEE